MAELVKSSWPSFGRREWISIILAFSLGSLMGMGSSLQAPLYPPEAVKKGVTASVYGAYLGFQSLLTCLFTPVVSLWILKGWFGFGVRQCLPLTFLIDGTCNVFYGLLDLIPTKTGFIFASFFIRAVDGMGSSGFCSFFMMICLVFPKRIAFLTGLSEPLYNLAIAVGPVLGEAVFEIGGYMAPFIGFGLLQVSVALILGCVLPEIQKVKDLETSAGDYPLRLLKLLLVPRFLLFCSATVVTYFGASFISTILDANLEQFHLEPVGVGVMFMLYGLPQLLGPVCGYLVDKFGKGELVSFFGLLVGAFGLVVLGPASFLPVKPTTWTTGLGLIIVGFGQAALTGSNFYNMMHGARICEGPIDDSFFSVIGASGYYIAAQMLGTFLGPTVAGVVFDAYGFRSAILWPLCTNLLMGLLILVFYLMKFTSRDVDETLSAATDETQPLLSRSNST